MFFCLHCTYRCYAWKAAVSHSHNMSQHCLRYKSNTVTTKPIHWVVSFETALFVLRAMLQDERILEHKNLVGKRPNRVLADVCFALRGYSANLTSVRKPKSTTRGLVLQLCPPRQDHWLHQTHLCNSGLVRKTGNVWGQLRWGSGD